MLVPLGLRLGALSLPLCHRHRCSLTQQQQQLLGAALYQRVNHLAHDHESMAKLQESMVDNHNNMDDRQDSLEEHQGRIDERQDRMAQLHDHLVRNHDRLARSHNALAREDDYRYNDLSHQLGQLQAARSVPPRRYR